MLHVVGVTPEAELEPVSGAELCRITTVDLAEAWQSLNKGAGSVDLVAIGSPHASFDEVRQFADHLDGRANHSGTSAIVTVGRGILEQVRDAGLLRRLEVSGVEVMPDLCWCSITEPVFPRKVRNLMTNSGKYAHYAPGLSGRTVRFGSLRDCADAAVTGEAPQNPPLWITKE
jgi:predicted aconitase